MVKTLKPSLQRIVDAREDIKLKIAEERSFPSPRKEILDRLRKEKFQLKDLLNHLQISPRFIFKTDYLYGKSDSVVDLLRKYLQDELATMLRGGKNTTSRDYIEVQNQLNIVRAEQRKRKQGASAIKAKAA